MPSNKVEFVIALLPKIKDGKVIQKFGAISYLNSQLQNYSPKLLTSRLLRVANKAVVTNQLIYPKEDT